MENSQVADIFDEIADLLELQEANEFRIRSYRNAARTVRDLSQRLEDLVEDGKELTDLPNIGDSTAGKIRQILETGTCDRLEKLRRELPGELPELMRVPQLGPRRAMKLYRALGVESLEDLRKVCEEHRVREVEGLGEKSEQKILAGIQRLEAVAGRFLLRDAADHVEALERHLRDLSSVQRWEIAGSFRRRKETIGDLDVLVLADDRAEATDQILDYGPIEEVLSRGEERVSVRLDSGLQIDFRFFEPEAFGAALMYFTGSKAHNIAVRQLAVDRDWKLNEYGLFKDDSLLAGKTEEAIYHRLNMAWVPPELREDRGEVQAAANGELPELIELDDIRGDFQAHTDATDGAATLKEMAEAARELGYHYLAITDHSQRVTVAGGLDEDGTRRQADAIRELDASLDDLWLMAGIEVDVLKDGSLDLDEDVLAELDWVVASVHYNRDMSEEDMSERLLSAIGSGVVHCLGHPTGRIIGEREPISFDVDRVLEACRDCGVWVEINAYPDRLDLPDTYCKGAAEAGVQFTISTDAHKRSDLQFMRFGVDTARRGWLEKKDVLNTRTVKQLRKAIQRG
ncbi:MAG: DNA polymerase/3'-5' exonuclease PolX [Candidatus Brocadiaceae bacterium]|jgi:DNA polymerase (family 10)